ncbi:MAG: TIGR03088 family PEP-CTERM/XrtA system glycosyltransferase [Lamprobacter sp.]|uniref:TIGR03088 family PEP-CTERM/XrtA system glycosyltransferase n=1 Tax=Lamprobacter sp. TaxID=3100796 RepID=UPI002B257913|nr:TIGR03088 family PEP-CTERM/XrtA system glycosyltransferase [Lamprobacter sp.]MEA3643038.1 TIGR03088 family PEP-CTERM/XrtA system glycosyltransferase [Lamprobacter sp.]
MIHIIHRLDVGGLENGLVNLINQMPADVYRHAIICMTDYTAFSERIQRDDIGLYALHKREGKDLGVHVRLWRLLRRLRPDIVHTRNLATLETQVTAALVGIGARVHGEHGWDVGDTDGTNLRHRRLRQLVRPFVGQYIALSRHQMGYLNDCIGVPPARLNHIYNGVDTRRFHPPATSDDRRAMLPADFVRSLLTSDRSLPAAPQVLIIGAVMRMQVVKAPLELARAFVHLRDLLPDAFSRLRLLLVGEGTLRDAAVDILAEAGVADQAWLPGARDDVPELMRAMDLFVVPSLAEGICNTILEAMATGLPVIATDVGGNPDLVQPGITGSLVPAADPIALAETIARYASDPERCQREGQAARARAERDFSLTAMVQGYLRVYDKALGQTPLARD